MLKLRKLAVTAFILLIITIGLTSYFCAAGLRNETSELSQKITIQASSCKYSRIDFKKLNSLPAPVRQYFKMSLKDGQKYIRIASFSQTGKLKINPDSEKWSPFKANQIVSPDSKSFIWNAKIFFLSMLHVRVRDSLINGSGSGKVSLMSAFTIAEDSKHSKLNSGALHRFLAEAVWYPTALLPENGVRWSSIDKKRALATLSYSGITVSLEFKFNSKGEITGVYTPGRYGLFNGKYISTPWEGNFSSYADVDGMRIPLYGEVGWHLPKGFWLFWQGKIDNIKYDFID